MTVGQITASDHIGEGGGWHRTTSEFHSLPHRTKDVTKTLRKDPWRKVKTASD